MRVKTKVLRVKKFALIGVGGYVAKRHLSAIKSTNNQLVASLDKNDSVGILDSYFPKSSFFVEYERFDRHIDKLRREGQPIDFVSICTPNYLHDAHIRFGLRNNADVICEKPLVLNPWNAKALQQIEKETNRQIHTILQLRLHDTIIALKNAIDSDSNKRVHDVDLTYITSRGNWYDISWKGNSEKSGGIATNIGIHFFDMLLWIFGDAGANIVHHAAPDKSAGFLALKNANVRWFLSLDANDLPTDCKEKNQRTFRSICVDGKELEFSDGFTDLHHKSYANVLNGCGFGIHDAMPALQTVFQIRNSLSIGRKGEFHPYLKKVSF